MRGVETLSWSDARCRLSSDELHDIVLVEVKTIFVVVLAVVTSVPTNLRCSACGR